MAVISSYKYDILKRALRELTKYDKYIEIIADPRDDKPLEFKVNWSAIGAQTPEVTSVFASALMAASGCAEFLNSLKLKIDWKKEEAGNGIANDTDVCTHILINNKYEIILTEWLEGEYEIYYNNGNLRRVTKNETHN